MRWLDGIIDSMDMSLIKLEDGEGQGKLVYCSPWDRKESDTTEGLNKYFLAAPPLFLHSLPSLISNCLNLPFEIQKRSWRLNETYFQLIRNGSCALKRTCALEPHGVLLSFTGSEAPAEIKLLASHRY